MIALATLETIRDEGSGESYPCHVLERCDTALVLFAAGFLGRQDAFWVAEAGVTATCVDIDGERLRAMERLYPSDWEFVEADVFEYAEQSGEMWDLVSIDCPTGAFKRCAELMPAWCDLARVAVVLGASYDSAKAVRSTPGWMLTDVRARSSFKGGVYWAVLERTA